MKVFKILVIGLLLGLGIGIPLGMNIGKGQPLLSNPFADDSAVNRVVQGGKKVYEGVAEGVKEGVKEVVKQTEEKK